jgi:uncharacterized membrane-anchored protein
VNARRRRGRRRSRGSRCIAQVELFWQRKINRFCRQNKAMSDRSTQLPRRVAQVTLSFWILRILAAMAAETASNFLKTNLHFDLAAAFIAMTVPLLILLIVKIKAKHFKPCAYWIVIAFASAYGTLLVDNLVGNFGARLEAAFLILGAAFVINFLFGTDAETTSSPDDVYTAEQERSYWVAIVLSVALGTVGWRLTAQHLHLGYAPCAMIFAALLGAVAVARSFFALKAVQAFWIGMIVTQPLGAFIGDFVTQSLLSGHA